MRNVLLTLILLLGSSLAYADKLDEDIKKLEKKLGISGPLLNCEKVLDPGNIALAMYRCENREVVCYIIGVTPSCKFKK